MIKATRSQNTLVLLWFIGCSAIVLWLGTSNKTDFDPNLRLSQALMDMTFEDNLIGVVDGFSPAGTSAARIIHITQSDYYLDCEFHSLNSNLKKCSALNYAAHVVYNLNYDVYLSFYF
jgi:hypothetical protein